MTAPTEHTGDEGLRATLADWQNWSATKLSETEMARLEYDLLALIRQDRQELLKRLKRYMPDEKVGTDSIPLVQSEIGYNVAVQDCNGGIAELEEYYKRQHGAESGEA